MWRGRSDGTDADYVASRVQAGVRSTVNGAGRRQRRRRPWVRLFLRREEPGCDGQRRGPASAAAATGCAAPSCDEMGRSVSIRVRDVNMYNERSTGPSAQGLQRAEANVGEYRVATFYLAKWRGLGMCKGT